MADDVIPVPVDPPRPAPRDASAAAIGHAAAGMLDYLIGVIDREDRLESGTGTWRSTFAADEAAAPEAVRSSVLRMLRLAAEAENFALLELLAAAEGATIEELGLKLGAGRLPLAERISDLVSAGLVVKSPEAGQVRATEAGAAVVRLVEQAVAIGARALKRSET